MVFTLADADTHDWRSRASTTLRGGAPAGPIVGFEAKDARRARLWPNSRPVSTRAGGPARTCRRGSTVSGRCPMNPAPGLASSSRARSRPASTWRRAADRLPGPSRLPHRHRHGPMVASDRGQLLRSGVEAGDPRRARRRRRHGAFLPLRIGQESRPRDERRARLRRNLHHRGRSPRGALAWVPEVMREPLPDEPNRHLARERGDGAPPTARATGRTPRELAA
jgi:ParB family chromosome partitioning protein